MASIYKGHRSPESEDDSFQTVKASTFDSEPVHDRSENFSAQTHKKSPNPFNRDFIDSLCVVVNRDLLFCKLFYFFFFGAFGSLFPLLAIYFKQLGMNASQSGLLIGFRPFIEFLSAPFWGSLADKWRRGKEMLLFSVLCWIVFTLAIAFVQPPAHKCLTVNETHTILEAPLGQRRRYASPSMSNLMDKAKLKATESNVAYLFHANKNISLKDSLSEANYSSINLPASEISQVNHGPLSVSDQTHLLANHDLNRFLNEDMTAYPDDFTSADVQSRHRRSPERMRDIDDLVLNPHSVVVYRKNEVAHAFFILLLLVIIGEFFSSPAIMFADSVTLSFLGDDTQNYGRQRMFGSLGWGLAMFFAGMALDHSTTFPDHPCGKAHIREKNYTVCFALFSVMMSCAFLAALQFRFDHHNQDMKLSEVTKKVKNKVKRIITGERKIHRKRLVEEYSDDEDIPSRIDLNTEEGLDNDSEKRQQDPNLKISLAARSDMVTDALKAPGAKAGRGLGGVTGAIPFGSSGASYSDQPFFGKWIAVIKLLATYQYLSVLFIAWFMGFGIGIVFTFLFWHLQDLGGSPTLFGVASVINNVSELLAYFMTGSFIERFGHVKILYAGLAGNIARFLYISFLRKPWWVMPFEFVQGLTHAAVWAACCAYIIHAIPVELRSSAQGILQGLHHGLGRGCGAVFGGLLVYQYGSSVTFRIYGVTCIFVLAVYLAINFFLQDRGKFSHGGKVPHELLEDTTQLAPHGVPSSITRNFTNARLTVEHQQEYGAVSLDGASPLPMQGSRDKDRQIDYSNQWEENPMHHGYDGERITSFESPKLPASIYKNKHKDSYDEGYSP